MPTAAPPTPHSRFGALAVAAACLCVLTLAGPPAGLCAAGGAASGEARPALEALARAWLAEDHAALAAMVASEGAEIAIGSTSGARNHYSPSQAFYLFKNLFQATEQDAFRILRVRQEGQSGLVHAVAEWECRRSGAAEVRTERLLLTLVRGESRWGLTGVRAVR